MSVQFPEPSCFLVLNEERFGVLGDVLAFSSRVFAHHRRSHPSTDYKVRSEVCSSSLRVFIDGCHQLLHSKPFEITRDNFLELDLLCEEFQIRSLQQQVHTFINTNDRSLLIPSIQQFLKQGRPTTDLERQLKAHLLDFLDDPELPTLPLNVLARVITFSGRIPTENNRNEFDRLFKFCLQLLDDQASSASMLFVGLDLTHCSASQIHDLHSRNSFLWAFLADSFPSTLITLISTIDKYKQMFETEHSEFEKFRFEHQEMKQLCDRQGQMIHEFSARMTTLEVRTSFLSFPLKLGPPPDGIISYLTRKHGDNPARLGLIKVDLSSVYSNDQLGPNVFDFMESSYACAGSGYETSQWIDFDFQKMRVKPTHYWIRSYSASNSGVHLKSWVLQCVDDEKRPVELDSRVNTEILNSAHAIGAFEIAHSMECRVVRLKSTSPTHWKGCANWRVAIAGFELFGLLRE
jgi:hypothetical protein